MYTAFFGLSEKPFAITPDPRYLYLSERHAEALAHLLYGINESGGFIQLTGEVGTGKTTIVRTLLSRVPHHADVALILNPRITSVEFLLTICEELGLGLHEADRDSVKQMVDALNRRLLSAHAEGRRIIVIVDEAQNLSPEVLEQVRLLTNLETATQKLLQIILIGQPELRELLDRNDLRQLAQRITGRYHLQPLLEDETGEYIRHRLRVAGAVGEILTPAALREAYRVSGGVPRVINVVCDRALLGAYTQETKKVTPALVRRAASEVYGRRFMPRWLGWGAGAVILAGLCATGFAGWHAWQQTTRARAAAVKPTAAAPAPPATAPAPPASNAAAASTAADAGALAPRALAADATDSGAAAARGAAAPAPATPASTTPQPATPQPAAPPPATPQPAAPPPATPPPAALNTLLAANTASTTDAAAFRRLLALWGKAMADDKDPCGQAQSAGLACFDQRGSWAQVRALNRPAILTLTDDGGRKHRVVLTGLDEHIATLEVGDQSVRIPIDDLSHDWFGEFTVVWRPKTSHTRPLSVGMQGDEVRWLKRSLNALRGAGADPGQDDVYDQELAIAVQNFQREHRLNADGVAGVQTQVVLDTALADPGSPLLTRNNPRS